MASRTTRSSSAARFSECSACPRAPEISASKVASLTRRASNSALPARMSGLTTGFPLAWICLIVGCA